MVVLASLYTLWLSHLGPDQLNCPEAGLSRGWSWSLDPVDMSEVRCAVSSRGRE